MWQRLGTKLFILIIVLGIGMNSSLLGEVKPEDKCYALDEKTDKLESGNMVTSTNYIWLPFMTPLAFDKKPCDPAVEGPLCQSTVWEGHLYYGLYHLDTTGGTGFVASRKWRLCACDRNGDGLFNNADLQLPFQANTDTSDPDMRYSYRPEPDYLVTHPGLNASFQVIPPQDAETPCSSGNCATEIITTMYLSLDADGLGGLAPVPEPPGGLCFYAEGRKPLEAVVSWEGNVQARVFSISGEKTLNFSFEAPTPVIVSSFTAYSANGQNVVQWETSSELKTAGFYLYRQDEVSREFHQVNQDLLPGLELSSRGGTYRYVDPDAYSGKTYVYKLSEVEVDGKEKVYGPFTVTFGDPTGPVPAYVTRYEKQEHPIPAEKLERISAAKASRKKALELTESQTGDVIKMSVQKSGLYFVSAQEVAAIFATPVQRVTDLIKTGNLSLTCQGQEVAWLAAENNGGFCFYGEAIDSLYTSDNVYWLRSSPGRRMTEIKGIAPAPSSSLLVFTETAHFEQDKSPAVGLFHDPGADYWVWDLVYGNATRSYNFQTPGASRTGTASLTLRLQGNSETPPNPDHHVVVRLNGNLLGEGYFDGIAPFEMNLTVDPTLLKDTGENKLEVSGKVDPGVPSWTMFFVDSFDVTYQRLYQAVSDSLTLRGESNAVVTVGGFSQKEVSVFDISVPQAPKRIDALTIEPYGGSYRVAFIPASPAAQYLAVAPAAIRRPVSLIADIAANLKQKSNGADYLIIAPSQFKTGAQALADYRAGRGLVSKVVELEDIYDEFSNGLVDPFAIRSFLTYASTQWRKAPRYVALAGDASIDYKNILGYNESLVPTVLVDTPDGLFASDGALTDVYGQDGIGDLAIGRLPVVTNAELEQLITKITAYESASNGAWKKQVLLAADKTDPQAGDFTADSEDMRATIPADFAVDTVYLSDPNLQLATARSRMINGISNGAYLVNYFGHGGWWSLSNDGLLTVDDIPLLVNGEKLPVVAAMSCSVGRFEMSSIDTLAERLLLSPSGGAIAVWSPTGWSYNDDAKILDQGLLQGMFSQEKVLGNIIQSAVHGYPSNGGSRPFMQQIYNLLGDPALQVW